MGFLDTNCQCTMKRTITLFFQGFCLSLPFWSFSQSFFIQSFNEVRSDRGLVSRESFSFATGAPYSAAREAIVKQFPNAQILNGIDSISTDNLKDIDVFILNPIKDTLSQEEICLLEYFVHKGGALLESRNLDTRQPILGTTAGPGNDADNRIVSGVNSLLIQGYIGLIKEVPALGYNFVYNRIGDALPVITSDTGPNCLQLPENGRRSGRAVFIGDEELFMTGEFPTERSGKFFYSSNDTFLLNVMAYLLDAPGIQGRLSGLLELESMDISPIKCENPLTSLVLKAKGGYLPYGYSIDNGKNFKPTADFVSLGPGDYKIIIEDSLGCVVSSSVRLPAFICPVYVPNVFSPNGDGLNDNFEIFTQGSMEPTIQNYDIFDRWGNHLYHAENFLLQESAHWWDGSYRGRPLENGIYVYSIKIIYSNGSMELLKGSVAIEK